MAAALLVAAPLVVEEANGAPPLVPLNARDAVFAPLVSGIAETSRAEPVGEFLPGLPILGPADDAGTQPSSDAIESVDGLKDREAFLRSVRSQPAAAAALDQLMPTFIRIPALSVEAAVVPVGTTTAGNMDTPPSYEDVGWWQHGVRPGEQGRAVLAGHVDSLTGPAVFYQLDQLQPGDEIFVAGEEHSPEIRFVVRESALYFQEEAPLESIFGSSDHQELILVTCGGIYDSSTLSYRQRRVIYAVAG